MSMGRGASHENGHGRIVHDIGEDRQIAFDATIDDPRVDEIFDPVRKKVREESKEAALKLREEIRKIRAAERARRRASSGA